MHRGRAFFRRQPRFDGALSARTRRAGLYVFANGDDRRRRACVDGLIGCQSAGNDGSGRMAAPFSRRRIYGGRLGDAESRATHFAADRGQHRFAVFRRCQHGDLCACGARSDHASAFGGCDPVARGDSDGRHLHGTETEKRGEGRT